MPVRSLQHSYRLKLSLLLALISLCAAMTAPRASQAQSVVCAEELVLQRGQTLATIAARVFGTQDGVADIIAATNAQAAVDSAYTTISDPNAVEAGWKICVPAASQSTASPSEAVTARRSGIIKSGTGTNSANSVKGKMDTTESGDQLMQQMLADRLGEDGIHPLTIEYLRRQKYPGSSLTIEETLPAGSNYSQYLVSYRSEGLTLYAAMTVPDGKKPATGWPVIIFNHGYIEPAIYSATERYTEYIDAIASSGYIVLRPDMRGHGNSQGEAYGAYGDPAYTIDVLNALASIKRYPDADPNRIGMWGHSMGGYIVARAMVVSNDIQAGVIWAGVVAPYQELISQWGEGRSTIAEGELPVPSVLIDAYGTPQENPGFWGALSANSYAGDLSGPVQLHHGTADTDVPVHFSDLYYADLIAAGQMAEYYQYPGDDHNISTSFTIAMPRSLEFLDTHVKKLTPTSAQFQAASPARLVP
jgi:dienelactone hydrolase